MNRPGALARVQVCALGDSLEEISAGARAAEAAGIEGVFAIELFRSTDTQAMWLAARTERIGINQAGDGGQGEAFVAGRVRPGRT